MTYWVKPKPPRSTREQIRDMLRALKIATPCTDCNKNFHFSAMHFDHIDAKSFDLSHGHAKGIDKVIAEVNKCEIVCANCHAVRTFKRQRRVAILSGNKRLKKGEYVTEASSREITN